MNYYSFFACVLRQYICEYNADLIKEFSNVCQANIIFFENLTDEAWAKTGTVNDTPASVSAIAYNMVRHVRHHISSLRSDYRL